jgi:hypothetical protein
LAGGTIGGFSSGLAVAAGAVAAAVGSAARLLPARAQSPAIPKTMPILLLISFRLFLFLKVFLKIKAGGHRPHDA